MNLGLQFLSLLDPAKILSEQQLASRFPPMPLSPWQLWAVLDSLSSARS
jgi:hypothetical protein